MNIHVRFVIIVDETLNDTYKVKMNSNMMEWHVE